LEESFFKDKRFWHTYHMREDETHELLTTDEEIHFLELKKMKEFREDSPITWWLEFIKDRATCKICEWLEKLGVDFHLTRGELFVSC
jgi:hypothetical protein